MQKSGKSSLSGQPIPDPAPTTTTGRMKDWFVALVSKKTEKILGHELLSEEDKEYLDMIRPRSWIMGENMFLFYFDFVVIISALYQGIFIPFNLFFISTVPHMFGGIGEGEPLWINLEWIQVAAEVVFYTDLFLGFFKCYFDSSLGEFIWKPSKVATHYLKGDFTINCLATLHWEFIFKTVFRLNKQNKMVSKFFTLLNYLKLLKLNDTLKIMGVLKGLNFAKETKALLFIVYYLLLVFIYVHFFACIFWFVTRQAS
jgi:hypothetical protein